MANGRLYLIPSPLGEYDPAEVIPNDIHRRHLKWIKDLSVMDGDASD